MTIRGKAKPIRWEIDMRFLIHVAAIGLMTGFAAAQELPAEIFGTPQSSGNAQESQDNQGDAESSELDRLSRGADDPFAGAIEQENRTPVSVTLRALDKVTARYKDLVIPMNEIAHFGSLEIQPRYCDKRPPEEFPETTAFLEIYDTQYDSRVSAAPDDSSLDEADAGAAAAGDEFDVREAKAPSLDELRELEDEPAPVDEAPLAPPAAPAPIVLEGPHADGVNIFRGWMFASSPALNALEHPVYDVWVIDCKTESVGDASEETDGEQPAAAQ